MEVYEYGSGSPTVGIVGGIHGDEPETAEVVRQLVEEFERDEEPLNGTVKLIIANERALDAGVRYTDTDLNRVFPGNSNSNLYEERLAADIIDELRGLTAVLSLHSTHSAPPPFAISSNPDHSANRNTILSLPVEYVVDTSALRNGSLDTQIEQTVELEAGEQLTESVVENGIVGSKNFLKAHNVLHNNVKHTNTRIVEVYEELEKQNGCPNVYYNNFEHISEGTVIAEDDGIEHTAKTDKVTPVLMSEQGYEDIFGLLGEFSGTITPEEAQQRKSSN